MTTDILRLDVRLRRRSTVGYAVGIGAYALVIVALYPAFKNSTGLDQMISSNPTLAALLGATGSLTSPAGWLNVNLYANFLPLIALLITIGYGASAIAGQAEEGTLALIATLPPTRRRMVAEKAATLCLLTVPTGMATVVCVLIGRSFDLTIAPGPLLGATVGALLLGIDFGAIALLVGCWTGHRGTALGVASALAAASYLIGSLGSSVSWMRPLRATSLFYWSVGDGQLSHGLSVPSAVILLGVALIAVGGAAVAIDRLDIP
jgi:ABC-2 type transport system permease protein